MKAISVKVIESTFNPGTWKVWVTLATGQQGWLRRGFAWKTRGGAMNAAIKCYPESFI